MSYKDADLRVMLRPFDGHFGITLGSSWGHLGITLGSSWDHFGVILGSLWGHLGVTLGSSWGHFGMIQEIFSKYSQIFSASFLMIPSPSPSFLHPHHAKKLHDSAFNNTYHATLKIKSAERRRSRTAQSVTLSA